MIGLRSTELYAQTQLSNSLQGLQTLNRFLTDYRRHLTQTEA